MSYYMKIDPVAVAETRLRLPPGERLEPFATDALLAALVAEVKLARSAAGPRLGYAEIVRAEGLRDGMRWASKSIHASLERRTSGESVVVVEVGPSGRRIDLAVVPDEPGGKPGGARVARGVAKIAEALAELADTTGELAVAYATENAPLRDQAR